MPRQEIYYDLDVLDPREQSRLRDIPGTVFSLVGSLLTGRGDLSIPDAASPRQETPSQERSRIMRNVIDDALTPEQ